MTVVEIYMLQIRDNHRIQKFNSSLVYQAKHGSWSKNSSAFYYPYGMVIDSSDNIYVADFTNQSTRKFNTSLALTASFGGVDQEQDCLVLRM